MQPENRAILRPLGAMEYVYWLMDLAARSNFVFVAKLSGAVPFQVIKAAAEYVRKTSPLLDAAILPDEAHGAVFVKAQGYACVSETTVEPENFISCVEDEQHGLLDTENGPLFRVKSISCDGVQSLVFTFHHSIADGISGSRMVLSFLEAADCIMRSQRPALSCLADFGPCEKLFPPEHLGRGAFLRALKWMGGMNIQKNILRKYPPLPLDEAAPPHLRRERFILKTMEKDAARLMAEKAAAEGASLHSTICAAQAMALRGEYTGQKPVGIGNLSLVDLRKRLSPAVPEKAMNVFVSTVESRHEVSPETGLWDLARQIEAATKAGLEAGSHFENFPSLAGLIKATRKITPNTYEGSKSLLKQGQITRPHVSAVSNIGRVEADRSFSSFSLEDLYFGMACSGTALFGSAVNSWNGRLYINFGHAEPCICALRAEKIARRAMDILSAP